jgi:general secretion pathway protein B
MSYILEALKKADQERVIGAVPDLATPHETKRPQTRSYRWLRIIVTLLSVNAVLVVMLLTDKDAGDAEVPITAQVLPEQQTTLVSDQLVQPIQATSEALISAAPTPQEPVLPENEPILSGGELVLLPEPAYLQDSRPLILPEEESDTQMDAMTSAQDNSQLQSWYELPQEFRNKLDLPRLDVHVYSEDPQRRFILVNLEKYREGERLASGLVLEEILPDGMVMSYQGERFRVAK